MTDAQSFRFGRFEIVPLERQLLIEGRPASLGARAFDLLLAFATSPGKLLTKNELLDLVWPNLVVEENNLQVQISTLRKLLGPDVIATIPGRGYRFAAAPAAFDEATPVAIVRSPAAPPSDEAAPLLKTNLPARLPVLIGRDEDLIALDALVRTHALITVVGAGGIGKTLLAQHTLQRQRARFAHGVCFVELASLADPRLLVGAVASAIGVQAGAGGDDGALDTLVQALEPLELLIALDNAEHLIDEVARVANALHAGAPRVTLLVTSQAPLQLGGEHVYRVGTLALPDDGAQLTPAAALGFGAVALFNERARQVDRRFELDDANVATTVMLCRRLDGLPLAIGLAAARVPLLGVEGLAAALGERLKLLTSGGRDASSRHRTLRAALEWSHGLLDEREQILFRRLGVVVGSATLELIRRFAADDALDEWSALDALSVLVDRSLVVLDSGSDDATPRYRLLESPRAFAIERLAAAGEADVLRGRHARAMAARWARAFEEHHDSRIGLDAWQREVACDVENARAAFAWAIAHDDAVTAVTLMPVLATMLTVDPTAQLAVFDTGEPLLSDARVPAQLRANALIDGSSELPLRRGMEWARRGLALYRSIGDARGCYLALAALAWGQGLSGDADGAAASVAEMDMAFKPRPGVEMTKRGEQAHAALAVAQNRLPDVLRHFRRCAELILECGGSDALGFMNVIEAEIVAGHPEEAVRDGEALLERLRGTRQTMRLTRLYVLLMAAWLALEDGAPRARAHAAQAWPQARANAVHMLLADHSALLAALEHRPRSAARLVGYADAIYAAELDARQITEAQSTERALALAHAALGEAEVARLKTAGAALSLEAAARTALAERDSAD